MFGSIWIPVQHRKHIPIVLPILDKQMFQSCPDEIAYLHFYRVARWKAYS